MWNAIIVFEHRLRVCKKKTVGLTTKRKSKEV